MTYAIFTKRTRILHAVRDGEEQTVCELPIGPDSGLVRDGNYAGSTPCDECWTTNPAATLNAFLGEELNQ